MIFGESVDLDLVDNFIGVQVGDEGDEKYGVKVGDVVGSKVSSAVIILPLITTAPPAMVSVVVARIV